MFNTFVGAHPRITVAWSAGRSFDWIQRGRFYYSKRLTFTQVSFFFSFILAHSSRVLHKQTRDVPLPKLRGGRKHIFAISRARYIHHVRNRRIKLRNQNMVLEFFSKWIRAGTWPREQKTVVGHDEAPAYHATAVRYSWICRLWLVLANMRTFLCFVYVVVGERWVYKFSK